jgi:predicted cobalt transporter CbtA
MPRSVEQLDENGTAVLDENGEPVTVPNSAREIWLTATNLTTALNLGIMAYALAAFAVVVGLALVANGAVFLSLRKSSFGTA